MEFWLGIYLLAAIYLLEGRVKDDLPRLSSCQSWHSILSGLKSASHVAGSPAVLIVDFGASKKVGARAGFR